MTNNFMPLSEVLYAFAAAMPVPDARTLEDFLRRYPEHADALTEFAVELALETAEEDEGVGETGDAVSPAVARAISHLHNVAYELEKRNGVGAAEAAANPLSALERTEFRAFATSLGVNNTFAMKLRDRLIEPESIVSRTGFCKAAADTLGVPLDAMVAHFQAAPSMPAGLHFKAEGKPNVVKRETFEEAVRDSGLTPEQQHRLLSL